MAMGKFDARSQERDGASPGKIFVGGLPKDTTLNDFRKHFEKYGEIIDHVIMKNKHTSQPRGFGFITFAEPSVVDKVIEDTHIFNGKQVEIKRTIPKGSVQSTDFKTKKIFVGGIPPTVTEDEFKNFFSKYGKVVEHEIIRAHSTNRPRGFGFVVFDSEQVVEQLLSNGNMIDLAGSQVEVKKAEPKRSSHPPPPIFASESRGRTVSESRGGFGNSSGFGSSDFDYPYRTTDYASRLGSSYGGYSGPGEYGGSYGGFGNYRGDTSLSYSSRFGSYGGSFGTGYAGGFGSYGRGEESFGGPSFGGSYETGPGGSYGTGPGGSFGTGGSYGAGGPYGNRGGYGGGGAGRYHPYGR